MKLPFDFNVQLIFRLVFPGFILATGLYPLVHMILHAMGIMTEFKYIFPIAVIALGWAVVVSDMRIYMLFEGRRYWLPPIRKLLMWRHTMRLEKLSKIVLNPPLDRRRYLEAGVEYGFYPIRDDSEAYVEFPTRLGNLIESFETYPKFKYGLDGVFYWYRLWVALDKDLREQFDSAQAVADSVVYISFSLYLSGILMLIYAIFGFIVSNVGKSYIPWLSKFQLPYVPGPTALCFIALAYLFFGYLVYRISLPVHAQVGELFKSIFDQYRTKIELDDVLKEVARVVGDPYLSLKSKQEKNQVVWRYLRWHLIRDENGQNLTVKQWKERQTLRVHQDKPQD